MSNVTRIRVELKDEFADRDVNFEKMFTIFKYEVAMAEIYRELKKHQSFETRSQKRRKKVRSLAFKRRCEDIKNRLLAGEKVYVPFSVAMHIYDDDGEIR